jgi:hypothetical protein
MPAVLTSAYQRPIDMNQVDSGPSTGDKCERKNSAPGAALDADATIVIVPTRLQTRPIVIKL